MGKEEGMNWMNLETSVTLGICYNLYVCLRERERESDGEIWGPKEPKSQRAFCFLSFTCPNIQILAILSTKVFPKHNMTWSHPDHNTLHQFLDFFFPFLCKCLWELLSSHFPFSTQTYIPLGTLLEKERKKNKKIGRYWKIFHWSIMKSIETIYM